MQLMLVRNNTPGPLVLVDERGGDRQEYQWQPQGVSTGEDLLEVPEALASNINFRRNVQKGNLIIEQHVDQDSLMKAPDADWIAQQRALAAGGVPQQVMGETRGADGVQVIMDKTAAAPITTITTDEHGNIVNVEEAPMEGRPQRGRAPQAQPAQQQQPQTAQLPQGQPQQQQGDLPPVSFGPPTGYQVPEQQQQSPQPIADAEVVPETAGGHLDPNAP